MNKRGRKPIYQSTLPRSQAEPVKHNSSSSSSYVETRKGNKYPRIEMSREQLAEKEIIMDMKDELHEFFRIDIVYCKDKIIHLIKQLRKHQWTSIHDISDEYIIDIDRYELLKVSEVTGVKVKNTQAQKLKEDLLSNKFNLQIEQFRIENTHDIPYNSGSYEYKKQFKNNLLVGITNYNIKQVNRKGKKGNIEDWHKEYDDIIDEDDDDNWGELEDQQEIEERKQDELFHTFLLNHLGIDASQDTQESQGKVLSTLEGEHKYQFQESSLDEQGTAVSQSQSSTSAVATQSQNNDNGKNKEMEYSQRSIEKGQQSSTRRSKRKLLDNSNSFYKSSNSNTINMLEKHSATVNKQKKKIYLSEDSSDGEQEDQIQIKPTTHSFNNSSDASDLDFQWISKETMVEQTKGNQFNQLDHPKQQEQFQEDDVLGGVSKKKESQEVSQPSEKVQKTYECIAIIDDDDEEKEEEEVEKKEDKNENEQKFNDRFINLNAQPYKKIKSNVI